MMITNTPPDPDAVYLPEWFVPTERDVICGWARQNHQHSGNKRYRKLIEHTAPIYERAGTKLAKTQVIAAVVRKVRDDARAFNGGVGGGFVKKDYQSGLWYEISNDKARDKVGHAIRRVVEDAEKLSRKKSPSKSKLKQDGADRSSGLAASKSNDRDVMKQYLLSDARPAMLPSHPGTIGYVGSTNDDRIIDTSTSSIAAFDPDRSDANSPLTNEKLDLLLNKFSDSPPHGSTASLIGRNTSSMQPVIPEQKQSDDHVQPSFVIGTGSVPQARQQPQLPLSMIGDASSGMMNMPDTMALAGLFNVNNSANTMHNNGMYLLQNQVGASTNSAPPMDPNLMSSAPVASNFLNSNAATAATMTGSQQFSSNFLSGSNTDDSYSHNLLAYLQERQQQLRMMEQRPSAPIMNMNYPAGEITGQNYNAATTTGLGRVPAGQFEGMQVPAISTGSSLFGGHNDAAATRNVSNLNINVDRGGGIANFGSASERLSLPSLGARMMNATDGTSGALIGLEHWEEAVKRDDFDESDLP